MEFKIRKIGSQTLNYQFSRKKVSLDPFEQNLNNPSLCPKMCVHILGPRKIHANLCGSHHSVRHGEVVIPVVAKRGVKNVEESLPYALKRVGIVIVEGRCYGIDDVLHISTLFDFQCLDLQGVKKAKVQDVKVRVLGWLLLQGYVVTLL